MASSEDPSICELPWRNAEEAYWPQILELVKGPVEKRLLANRWSALKPSADKLIEGGFIEEQLPDWRLPAPLGGHASSERCVEVHIRSLRSNSLVLLLEKVGQNNAEFQEHSFLVHAGIVSPSAPMQIVELDAQKQQTVFKICLLPLQAALEPEASAEPVLELPTKNSAAAWVRHYLDHHPDDPDVLKGAASAQLRGRIIGFAEEYGVSASSVWSSGALTMALRREWQKPD